MIVSVILAHPYKESFNHAISDSVIDTLKNNGHTVLFHDLYEEKFDPVLPGVELVRDVSDNQLVKSHQEEIKETEGIIIIHPNWWGQPPAILKGWVDRVLRQDIAYAFHEGDTGGGLPIGLLNAKAGIVFNTSNTPREREETVFGDPLERIWKDCIFDFCGIVNYQRKMYRVVADSTETERKEWLEDIKSVVGKFFPSAT